MKELSNKELADRVREIENTLLLDEQTTSDFVAPLEEAARRLQFGHTPPEAPPVKTPIELKREEELHAAKMAQLNRARSAGLGGHGQAVFVQSTGELHLFHSSSALREFMKTVGGTNLSYNRVSFHDVAGNDIVLVDIDHG